MYAAAEGHSNLGIPESVGKEFVRSDAAAGATRPALGDLNDMEAAESVRDGELPSPTKFGEFWLFDLRVTGTGAAYRDSIDEWAHRDPAIWLSDEFVKRAASIPVIWLHPEGSGLNQEEYRDRSIGNMMLAYVKGDEVWGVAKIFDADAALLMQTTHRSTSPGVTPPKGSIATELNDGTKVLDEGLPLILDHLAICEAGVWDKSGPPDGIRLDALTTRKDSSLTEEEEKALKKERDDAIAAKADAEKERDDAKVRADAAEAEHKADKARHDKDESDREELAAAEREKADKKKKHDAARADFEKRKDSESDEDYEKRQDSRMDDESDEEFDERKKDRAAKKDAAKQAEIEANRGTREIKDAKTVDELRQIVERQGRQIASLSAPPSLADESLRAAAFTRADQVFQMLGEVTPAPMANEKPVNYRRRLADLLRPFTDGWKNYAFHDSQQAQDFEAIENLIYADAIAASKKAIVDKPGFLRMIVDKTSMPGKVRTSFVGDPKAAWIAAGCIPPTQRFITRFNREPHRAASR